MLFDIMITLHNCTLQNELMAIPLSNQNFCSVSNLMNYFLLLKSNANFELLEENFIDGGGELS